MPFPLEPPYGRGMHNIENVEPVMEGPLLVRTRGMSRWHRVKSAVRFLDQRNRTSWTLWCGQSASGDQTISRDDLPTDGLPVCGPCEGKALGAGYNGTAAIVSGEAFLLFEPESQTRFRRPTRCPGAGAPNMHLPAEVPTDGSVGICGACRLHVAVKWWRRGTGYDYHGWDAPVVHGPGPDLVDPCPFHAWDELRVDGDRTVCACVLQTEQATS